jgi:hypothetical protein
VSAPLAVIVPTRGRPGNAARLAAAFRDTDALLALPVFVADEDDPHLPAYRQLLEDGLIPRLMIQGYSRGQGLCGALNYAAIRYAELYDAVGFMGDDHLPRTVGWDDKVMDALDSLEPRVVYGNDLLQGANLPTAVFMQSRMVRVMEMMAPAVMRHLYLDNFWKELGEALNGLVYLPEVIIEHLHPVAGKAAWDERYTVVNSGERDQADRREWADYRYDGRFDIVVRRIKEEYSDAHPAA